MAVTMARCFADSTELLEEPCDQTPAATGNDDGHWHTNQTAVDTSQENHRNNAMMKIIMPTTMTIGQKTAHANAPTVGRNSSGGKSATAQRIPMKKRNPTSPRAYNSPTNKIGNIMVYFPPNDS
jgi:hypothetical protein